MPTDHQHRRGRVQEGDAEAYIAALWNRRNGRLVHTDADGVEREVPDDDVADIEEMEEWVAQIEREGPASTTEQGSGTNATQQLAKLCNRWLRQRLK